MSKFLGGMKACPLFLAITVAVAGGVTSCKSHKGGVAPAPTEAVAGRAGEGSYADRLAKMSVDDSRWSRVKVPVTLRLDAPTRISVSGTATVVRDTAIFISMRMFGFEVAQIYVASDRLLLVDKYHKKYLEESTSSLLKGYNLNVSNVQSLLMGQPFVIGESAISAADVAAMTFDTASDATWTASASAGEGLDYGFVFDNSDILLGFAATASALSGVATCEYGSQMSHGSAVFAGTTSFNVPLRTKAGSNAKSVSGELVWNLGKAKWDSDVDWSPLSTPAGYQRLSADEVLKTSLSF